MEVFDLKDAGGATIHIQMRVDGMRINTFGKPPEVTAAIIRNIKNIKIRDDDVMLCTPPKSGTHWCFEILSMLLNKTTELSPLHKVFMMLANVPEDKLETFPSPRILNTHFPFRMLPEQMKEKKTKIILLLRNPKDTVVSFYHHHRGVKLYDYDGKFSDYLKLFMQGNLEYNSWFNYVLEFEKAMEQEPERIHLVYYEDLHENGVEEIAKLAKFLGLDVASDKEFIKEIIDKCQIKNMREGKKYDPEYTKRVFRDGFSFYRKGVIGDWKNYFTVAESETFDAFYNKKMKGSKLNFRFEPNYKCKL